MRTRIINVISFAILLSLFYSCFKTEGWFVIEQRELNIQDCNYQDSISIKCYTCENISFINAKGRRIFPNSCLNDDEVFKQVESQIIYSVVESGDILFLFSTKKDMFYTELQYNENLPLLNDSTIIYNYEKIHKYKIQQDTDPPFWTIIENEKDRIVLNIKRDDNDKDKWIEGVIRDNIFTFGNGLNVGISKEDFFKKMGITINYDKKNFTIILTNIYESKTSWYFKYVCDKKEEGADCGDFNRYSYLKYFFTFENNKLTEIKVLN